MDSGTAIRFVYLLVPAIILTWGFLTHRYSTREKAGAFLGLLWHGLVGLMLAFYGVRSGWWQFDYDEGGALYGVALDAIIAQAMIAGGIVGLVVRKKLWPGLIGACLLVYGAYQFLPFIHVGESWHIGFVSMLALVVIPAVLLAYWTATDTYLYPRALLQPILWAGFLLWLIPMLLLVPTHIGWAPLLQRSLSMQLLYCIPLLIPAYLILNALYVFARDGGGTGFPYDPPKRLVTTGVYAHLSNPMQLGICLLMAWWGVMVECVYVSLTSLVALMLFTVFKQICNGSSQVGKTDPRWSNYQRTTPKWVPRLMHSNK